MELKQSISVGTADVGGSSSSSGSAAAHDLGGGQQRSSSADPGVDTIEVLLPCMYVFPCVSCTGIKLALEQTFTFRPGASPMIQLLFRTRLPRWDLNDLCFAHTFIFSGVGSV